MPKWQRPTVSGAAVGGAKLTVASERGTKRQSVECRKPLSYAVLQMHTLSRTLGTSFAILHNADWMRCQIEPMRPLNDKQQKSSFESSCRD
jgi:hypothetical protein